MKLKLSTFQINLHEKLILVPFNLRGSGTFYKNPDDQFLQPGMEVR